MNTKTKMPLPRWVPLVVGAFLVAQFAGLGAWQISRGLEKRATQYAYQDESSFAGWHDGMEVRPYQMLQATGQFDSDHQVILENIILNSRYGFYIVTPLVVADDAPVLLVNRGWLEKGREGLDHKAIDVSTELLDVRGRAGSLPRVGMKMGDAITPSPDWPKYAVYPSLEEVAEVLGRDVQPFVLLMDHEDPHGFYRHWVPAEFGPGKHFGYALQWFSMAAVLAALLIWNYRKRRVRS